MDAFLTAFKTATWIGSLPFNGHLCLPSEDFCASSAMKHDLFEYTTSSLYKGPMKFIVRFSPLLYPTVGGFGKDSGGQKLITDLCQAARSHGNCALISNGSSAKACKDQRVLLCSNGRKYHQRLDGAQADAYRVTTYIGDKKNSRGSNNSGKALRRRNCTQRDTRCTCSAKIVIRLDQYSFHLVCGVGDNQHRGHPPMSRNEITNRKRFLDAPTLENAAAMAAANILPSQAALFTRSSTGELFTRGQMAYVQGFSRMAQDLMDSSPQGAALPSDMSPSDSMLNYLQKIGASFVCLFHNGNTKEMRGQNRKAARTEGNPVDDGVNLTSLSMVTTMESAPAHKSVPLEVTETADFKEYAQRSRHAVGARDDQDILIACCWVLPDGRRLFQAFPEVVCIDGTHETNNESRPLLTLSVKDSDGNVMVVVRCFAPNERSWLFRWLFQEALPVLLGTQTLRLVKLVMTDGDSQEMAQVDYAIATYLVNAVRSRCGWHLVHQGWRRECRGLGFRKGKRDAARSQVRVIQNWLYSWMRRGVDSKEEYEV